MFTRIHLRRKVVGRKITDTNMFNPKVFGCALAAVGAAFWIIVMGFSLITGAGYVIAASLGGFFPIFSYSFFGLIAVVIEQSILCFLVGWSFARAYNYISDYASSNPGGWLGK